MGGTDKGLQAFRGEPLVAHVLRRLAPQVGPVLVSANRNRARYEAFGLPVVADGLGGYAGPLAGLQAGLLHCTTEYLVTAPCDAPFVPSDFVARLAEALDEDRRDLAVASVAGRLQPVFCLMRRSLRDSLAVYLEGGGRAIHPWIERVAGRAVAFGDAASFRNLNTLDDLHDSERPTPDER